MPNLYHPPLPCDVQVTQADIDAAPGSFSHKGMVTQSCPVWQAMTRAGFKDLIVAYSTAENFLTNDRYNIEGADVFTKVDHPEWPSLKPGTIRVTLKPRRSTVNL